jgi:gingipain R
MEPFITHKKARGMAVEMVAISTIGNDSTKIKSYIQNYYDTNKNSYVLLVGDYAQITSPSASGGASDPSYAKVAGSDDYPDIIVGRFSAESEGDVNIQVQKTVKYETSCRGDWCKNALGIGSDQGPGHGSPAEYDYVHVNNMLTDLVNYGYTQFSAHDPGSSASKVSSIVNPGVGVIVYTGHGSTTSWGTSGFSNSNVNSLMNGEMLPFIFSVACVNGKFNGYTCFGEAWLRATNGGAIGMYASSINQSWNPPMDGEDECIDLLVSGKVNTFGGLCYNGSCKMMDVNAGTAGSNMYNTWHIFGDPSLKFKK